MAEGFELYHVPQQSRRDKLRVNTSSTSSHLPLNNSNNSSFQFQPTTILTSNHQQQQQQAGGLVVPFYDPSLHLDLLTCAGGHGLIHPQSSHLLGGSSQTNNRSENPSVVIKGEGTSFMGFLGNPPNQANNSSSSSPSLIDPNNSQVFYAAQNREFGHSQGLSLSLSSHNNNNNNNNSNNNTHLPMELNFQYSAPPGPFTGYTSVLKGSVFLRPAQQLLQEICDVGGFCSGEKSDADLSLFDPSSLDIHPGLDDSSGLSDGDGVGAQAKSRLISMLDEVYRKYKQCYQQVQAVVASFESIPGLNNAAPFANFALKALSKHFKCLKSAISDQLRFISKTPGTLAGRKHGHEESSENDKFALYSQRPVHSGARIMDNQPVWRPQRGLPERAVSVLRSWLFEHFLHPYPTDTDKMMLAKQTGLSRSQVSNWFINARVRIWKPMVEEIHALETNQQAQQQAASTSSQAEPFQPGQTNSNKDHTRMSQASCSSHDVPPEKRVRNELVDLPLTVHHHENPQLNMDYAQFGVSNGVSLTLALHQHNHGINGLLDPFRYGLPTDGNGCVVGPGFEAQTRHFSTRDVMGGQLLHDFVG